MGIQVREDGMWGRSGPIFEGTVEEYEEWETNKYIVSEIDTNHFLNPILKFIQFNSDNPYILGYTYNKWTNIDKRNRYLGLTLRREKEYEEFKREKCEN